MSGPTRRLRVGCLVGRARTPSGAGSTPASALATDDRGVPPAVHALAVGGPAHLGGHLVQGQVQGGHLVLGGGLGPDHRALGERGQLDADGSVGLAGVALLLDLDLDPDDAMVVLLQSGELLLDVARGTCPSARSAGC